MSSVLRACWPSVVLPVLALVLTTLVILYAPREYRSESLLLLRVGRENVALDPTATTGETIQVQQNRESEVRTALAMLRSDTIASEVADVLGPDSILSGYLSQQPSESDSRRRVVPVVDTLKTWVRTLDPIDDMEQAVLKLHSGMKISAPRDSHLISVAFETKSPELAQQVVSKWVEAFLAQRPALTRTQGTFHFFEQQSVYLREKLTKARNKLQEAKDKAGVLTITNQQQLVTGQIATARAKQTELRSSLSAAESRLEQLENQLRGIDERVVLQEISGVSNAARDGMRERLYELEIRKHGMESGLTKTHPSVKMLDQQLAGAQEVVQGMEDRTEKTLGVNPVHQTLFESLVIERANCHGIRSELIAYNNERKKLDSELVALNSREKEILLLERETAILDSQYQMICEKMEHARIDEELEAERITSINIVQEPMIHRRPVSPNKKVCAAVGLFAAIVGFLGPIFLKRQPIQEERVLATARGAESASNSLPTIAYSTVQPR